MGLKLNHLRVAMKIKWNYENGYSGCTLLTYFMWYISTYSNPIVSIYYVPDAVVILFH